MANTCIAFSNLMAPDDFKNLGLVFAQDKGTSSGPTENAEKKA